MTIRFLSRAGRSTLALLLLLNAGCDSREEQDMQPAAESQEAPAGDAADAASSPQQQAARNQARAAQALSAILVDPKSARYSEVRKGTAGSVCGLVDSKRGDGSYAGPRPFVVTPEGVAVISDKPRVMFDDPEDIFPDFYIRWCASPEELKTIGGRVPAGPLPEISPVEELPNILDAGMPPVAATPEPAEDVKPPPPPAPRPSGDDSFAKAVLRNRNDGSSR